MLPLYTKISRDTGEERRMTLMQCILIRILSTLQQSLNEITFTETGIKCFLLDVHFILLASREMLGEQIVALAADLCSQAVGRFRTRDKSATLPPLEWYDERAQEILPGVPLDFGSV